MKYKLLLVIALALFIPLTVNGATLKTGDEYSLRNGETINDDLYVGVANAIISGDVNGDLSVASGNVFVEGDISNDLLVAGGTLYLSGQIGDDLRAAGGNIIISGEIKGDLIVAGGQVHLTSGGSVSGDVIAAGGRILLEGPVSGNLKGFAGEIELNNIITGTVQITADSVVVGPEAVIASDFNYKAKAEADIHEDAAITGAIEFTERTKSLGKSKSSFLGILGIGLLIKFLAILFTTLVLIYVFEPVTKQIIERSLRNFGKELLRGFLILIAVPIFSILLLITLIGIPFGIIGLLLYVVFLILSGSYAALVAGNWIERKILKNETVKPSWKTAVFGIVAYSILGLIPIIGWILILILFLNALGAMAKTWHEYLGISK